MADKDKAKVDPSRLIPVADAFDIISFGVSAINETSQGIKNSFKDRLAQKEQVRADKKIQAAKLLNAKKQADKEKSLESKPKESKGGLGKNVKKTVGGIFQRVLAAAAAVFTGWLLVKLPAFIKSIAPVIEKITAIFQSVWKIWDTLTGGMDEINDASKNVVSALDNNKNIPKDSDKVLNEFKNIENDLKQSRKDLDKNLEGTMESIKKFANDRGDGDVPLHDNDEKAHASGDKPAEGLDMSGHKQMHKNMEGDIKNVKKNVKGDKNANGTKQKVEENKNIPPIVKKEVETITKTITIKQAGTGHFDMKSGKAYINDAEVKMEEYMKFQNSSLKDKVKNYGVTKEVTVNVKKGDSGGEKKKVVTPSGLGMDMYSRKIILNPDAARGWQKVLRAAAEDGIDLTKAVTSSYRSPEKQREIIADPNSMTPAPVDKSPHVQGWAIDLAAGTPEWEWLKKNGSKYGWRWNTDPNDPVHFDFMGGNPDNKHWIQPGKNNWMQGNMKTGEKVASLKKEGSKTIVPVPINKLQAAQSPPAKKNLDGGGTPITTHSSGRNLVHSMKTIDRAYT